MDNNNSSSLDDEQEKRRGRYEYRTATCYSNWEWIQLSLSRCPYPASSPPWRSPQFHRNPGGGSGVGVGHTAANAAGTGAAADDDDDNDDDRIGNNSNRINEGGGTGGGGEQRRSEFCPSPIQFADDRKLRGRSRKTELRPSDPRCDEEPKKKEEGSRGKIRLRSL